MLASVIPAFLMGGVSDYAHLVTYGFLIGVALASFSVGVSFVSGRYPPERQGFALGVYGAGNIGQSLAAYGSPVLAATAGFKWGFWTFGILLSAWLVIFAVMARNAPNRPPAKAFSETVRPLSDKRSWFLSLYYFLTFGGFVAMAVYLPTLLTEVFKLTPQDAGLVSRLPLRRANRTSAEPCQLDCVISSSQVWPLRNISTRTRGLQSSE